MRARAARLAAIALAVLGACGDDRGPGIQPSASGVFPAQGFIGRDTRVEISGDATAWAEGTKVSFGDNVTVNDVAVASPTSLFVDLTIEPLAKPGLTDVVVTDQDGEVVSLAKAFELDNALAVNIRGSVAQGSLGHFTVSNLDIAHPFDVNAVDAKGSQNGVSILSPPGVTFDFDTVNAFEASGRVFFDLDAASGSVVADTRFADGTEYTWQLPAMTVEARSPLTLGTIAGGTIESPFSSRVYQFTADALTFTDWSISAPDGVPKFSLLPESGKWVDAFAQQALFSAAIQFADLSKLSQQQGDFFLVVEDDSGVSGYDYALAADVTNLASVGDASGTTAAAGQLVASGKLVTGGSFANASDEHWFRLTNLPPGASIRVITDGDPANDAIVKLYAGVPADDGAPFATSSDSAFHEDLTAHADAGGTVSVLVRWSDGAFAAPFDPTNSHYTVVFIVD